MIYCAPFKVALWRLLSLSLRLAKNEVDKMCTHTDLRKDSFAEFIKFSTSMKHGDFVVNI